MSNEEIILSLYSLIKDSSLKFVKKNEEDTTTLIVYNHNKPVGQIDFKDNSIFGIIFEEEGEEFTHVWEIFPNDLHRTLLKFNI